MGNELSLTGTLWWLSVLLLVAQAHFAARSQTGQRLLDAIADRIRGRKREV